MDATTNIESVSISDILDLASWNRPRSNDELISFITSRTNRLATSTEIE